jgi:hypothetical protein
VSAVDLTIGGIFLFNGISMPFLIAYCFAAHIRMTGDAGP